ncbi:MAG: energy-coupled thiamine transporter ThiT [Lachnospiraceae bacterium]|nr:energy-coupled thiamine transporter ThiT [Lachnospiraceae bacterium]
MSMFLIYDAENYEYILQPAGYLLLAVILIALLASIRIFSKKDSSRQMSTRQLVFCSMSIALATVTSFIKLASLPFGGSITLFSMLFVSLIGYFYGAKTGLLTGLAYGILQLITGPYIYAPLQVLLDYPLAFGALGLSGFFQHKKNGLITGYMVGTAGRYICHVISGYVFFAEYAPEGMNPMVYTLGYNLTYILPEVIATVIILCIPAVYKAIGQVKQQACA